MRWSIRSHIESLRNLLPELPTVGESGYPGYEVNVWYAFLAPAGTPKSIVERIRTETIKALQTPDVQAQLDRAGCVGIHRLARTSVFELIVEPVAPYLVLLSGGISTKVEPPILSAPKEETVTGYKLKRGKLSLVPASARNSPDREASAEYKSLAIDQARAVRRADVGVTIPVQRTLEVAVTVFTPVQVG